VPQLATHQEVLLAIQRYSRLIICLAQERKQGPSLNIRRKFLRAAAHATCLLNVSEITGRSGAT